MSLHSAGRSVRLLAICLLAPTAVALAQENPLSGFEKMAYTQVKAWFLRSADKMPEANYAFKPTDSVRSFGQLLGHVADSQYLFCSVSLGEKDPAPKIEQTKSAKPDLVAALRDAFAYCDKAYDGMTDAAATKPVKFFSREMPALAVLATNNMHNAEHYGNVITYLRLKNLVPPSSEPPAAPPAKKQ